VRTYKAGKRITALHIQRRVMFRTQLHDSAVFQGKTFRSPLEMVLSVAQMYSESECNENAEKILAATGN
jgi:hypothetical protein